MEVIRPGQYDSTFGCNPIAAAVAISVLEVISAGELADNAFNLGAIFRMEMDRFYKTSKIATSVRGKGLLNPLIIKNHSIRI